MRENNLRLIVALSLGWSIQLTALLSYVLSFIPKLSSIGAQVFPEWQYLLKPEWDSTVYHAAIAVAILIFGGLRFNWRNRLNHEDLFKTYRSAIVIDVLITIIWLGAYFKLLVYSQQPQLATTVMVITIVMAILLKFFYTKVASYIHDIKLFLMDEQLVAIIDKCYVWFVPTLIALAVLTPNLDAVVARQWIGEQYHHNDSFIFAPVWAFLNGQTLDVDVISQYGIGFVVLMGQLVKLFGGFDITRIVWLMMILSALYYIAWFLIIKRVIKDKIIVAIVMLLIIKWQMLHSNSFPMVFTYGSQTPIRFLYDVMLFACLWFYINQPRLWLLYLTAAVCGFGIYYFTTEGVYGTAAFVAFLILIYVMPSLRAVFNVRVFHAPMLLLTILATAVFLLFMTIGGELFKPLFWSNIGEFVGYFTNYFGLQPMTQALVNKQFLVALMSLIIPLTYLATVLVIGAMLWVKRYQTSLFWIMILSLYGLATYHYYVARSTGTSYAAVIIPFVIVLGFWFSEMINRIQKAYQQPLKWSVFAFVFCALITTHQWIAYPNYFNLSRNPMTDPLVRQVLPTGQPYFNHLFRDQMPALSSEANFLSDDELILYKRKVMDLTVDVDLIRSLTSREQEVPVIASFEVSFLSQAKRKPFFYYFPLVISKPLEAPLYPAISIYTKTQMTKTIDKFEAVKPKYVFLEKYLVGAQINEAINYRYPSTVALLNYINANYEPYQAGRYLVALRRKP